MFSVYYELSPLFDAVYAAPQDLSRRQVLADALLERGDVRGEFIALQLDASTRARKRAAKLLARHRERFLWPLSRIVSHDEWRHGFLFSAHAWLDGSTPDEPAWATVEQLVVHLRPSCVPRELASVHWRSLRRLFIAYSVDRGEHEPWKENQGRLKAVREQLLEGRRPHVLREGDEWRLLRPAGVAAVRTA